MKCSYNTTRNKWTFVLLIFLIIALSFVSAYLALKSGIASTLLIKIGLGQDIPVNTDSYKSWANCLEQLDIDADVVFIGDSITANCDFQALMPDKVVCNLGCYGNQIWDITARISAVKIVDPEEIYIMVGINTLGCRTLKQAMRSYSAMIDAYLSAFPECNIVLLSVLPIVQSMESGTRTNANIMKFNAFIQNSANNLGIRYIDLFSLYALNGTLNPDFSADGLHVTPESYSLWVDAI